ncbi:MAG: tRNA (N6-isopentenyl adenosine(37)-C2)-methylthiotransferase MiaB [Parvularculaceae bacterium]
MKENSTITEVAAPEAAPRAGKSAFIRTYGCQMNAYDSERMAGLLRPLGYEIVDAPEAADLVILNTCHIREKAVEKVYSDLGRLRAVKSEREAVGADMMIAVAGCVAQAEGGEIIERMPIVDMVFGPQAYHRLPEMLARTARSRGDILDTDFAVEEKFDRLAIARDIEGPTAFLTIQEGCDKFCTFCVVPYTRGAEVSRETEAIVAEARMLAARGVREVTLLGQNVNAWRAAPARDPLGAPIAAREDGVWGLGQLCRHLARIEGIERIRFTTSHPRDMDADLIAAFGEEEALMPYLHLPVQSGADRILAAMNRGHTEAEYAATIARLRAARPDIALSGDFIVGFPGETDEDFEATLAHVERTGYAASFSFKYSRRPGTPAAAMAKQVAEPVKEERLARLQALLEAQRVAFNEAQIGKVLPVLFEKPGRNPGQLVGKSPYLQSVHASAPESMLGKIAPARIEGVTPRALAGVICGDGR